MKKIIVTGCNGQLGRAVNLFFKDNKDISFVNTDVGELDITNIDKVMELAREVQPYAIINCAAHTGVDACETEYDLSLIHICGEQSGHVIFLDENTTGDGLLSALHLLEVMVDTGKPLSELASIMTVMPQALVNARVPNHKKDKYMEYPEIAGAIDELNRKFAGDGRVLIRPSGTEPKVRVMIEGRDQKMIDEEAHKLADLIQNIML